MKAVTKVNLHSSAIPQQSRMQSDNRLYHRAIHHDPKRNSCHILPTKRNLQKLFHPLHT